jgi:hypothetical protein
MDDDMAKTVLSVLLLAAIGCVLTLGGITILTWEFWVIAILIIIYVVIIIGAQNDT